MVIEMENNIWTEIIDAQVNIPAKYKWGDELCDFFNILIINF